MDPSSPESPDAEPKAWLGVFAHYNFAIVWLASTFALVGISMYDTASGWLMTTLALDPLDVSLVHAATSLPMFLFTLPAGALADIVDPRRLILYISCGIALLIVVFAGVVSLGLASPLSLLLTTFLLSAAWSVNAPAWLAILPALVPKSDLAGAIAANGVAYNLSRTIGPAVGGLAIVRYGVSAPFWAFAAANLVVIAALLWWRAPAKQTASLPAERLTGAVRTGLRHAVNNRLFRATLMRTLAVYPFAAAYMGLMPLIARGSGEGAENYGLLLSMISAGALVGSLGLRFLRRFINLDWMVALGSLGTAVTLVLFGSKSRLHRPARRVVPGRRLVGRRPDEPLRLGPERAAAMGPGPRPRDLSHRHLRRGRPRQRGLGTGGGEVRRRSCADRRRRWRASCNPADLAVETA